MNGGKLTIQSSESGGSIQFSRNVSFGITIESGAECIVDAGVTIEGETDAAILFNDSGTCTIKKDATIRTTGTNNHAVITQRGKITIEDGAVLQAEIALKALDSDVIIKGGTIWGKFVLGDDSTATITGGTFEKGIDVSSSSSAKTLSDLMASGYILLQTADDTEVDLSQNTVTDSVYVKSRFIRITEQPFIPNGEDTATEYYTCLLYTSDAADEL